MDLLYYLLLILGFIVLLIVTQSIQVFPGALFSIFNRRTRDASTLHPGMESSFIETADGKSIEVWRLPCTEAPPVPPYVGVVFHGNGGSLENFLFPQLWFQELGLTSYGFDYRGFGKSSGWPSEEGLYLDSDAVWRYIMEREKIDPKCIVVCGISLGGAPAARIASKHKVKALILVSAFTGIKQVIKEQSLIGLLAPFVWYKFPTIDYVRGLKDTQLILACGGGDEIVHSSHAQELADAYAGTGKVKHLICESAGHNATFFALKRELAAALLEGLSGEK